MVSEWKRGESITFTKNPDYWGEIPLAADTLVFRWSSESAARLLELQSGTIDGFDNVGPDDFATIEGDSNLHLQIRPALNVFYVGMTNTYPPFDNVKVRQAVAMGIDRQRIVDTFYPAGSEVASHFTPCAIPNACVGESWYDFDVDAAKALLAEAGFPEGFSTKLYYRDVVRGYLPQVGNVAQDIQAQLKENLNIALSNIARHSEAGYVDIKLVYDQQNINCTITDNGIGFDQNEKHTGFGLRSLKERTLTMGGKLTIHSTPGEGTFINFIIPIHESSGREENNFDG